MSGGAVFAPSCLMAMYILRIRGMLVSMTTTRSAVA